MLPSLPAVPNLAHVLSAFPRGWPALLDAHDEILRGESPLSIGEREFIAAYVSGLNRCEFCYNAHTVYAESFGFSLALVEAVLCDLESAPISDRFRPVLAYAQALTRDPAAVTEDHVAAILNAGWPEEAVMDTAMVVALFSFMNRIVLGTGVAPHHDYYRRRRSLVEARSAEDRLEANQRELGTHPYRDYGRQIGLVE